MSEFYVEKQNYSHVFVLYNLTSNGIMDQIVPTLMKNLDAKCVCAGRLVVSASRERKKKGWGGFQFHRR